MNSTYSEFKFPIIKAVEWPNVFQTKNNKPLRQKSTALTNAQDLISKLLKYNPETRLKPLEAL
jgi:hypothetical protein